MLIDRQFSTDCASLGAGMLASEAISWLRSACNFSTSCQAFFWHFSRMSRLSCNVLVKVLSILEPFVKSSAVKLKCVFNLSSVVSKVSKVSKIAI